MVIAATNRLDDLDLALRSRLKNKLALSLPNEDQRKAIIEYHLNRFELSVSPALINKVTDQTHNFSGRDIVAVIENIKMKSAIQTIQEKDIKIIIDDIRKTLSKEQLNSKAPNSNTFFSALDKGIRFSCNAASLMHYVLLLAKMFI